MKLKSKNTNLHAAKTAKNDEFYTQLEDVSRELKEYREHFKGKVVLCNCDDPTWSAFWRYFHLKFNDLGLKKLISTHYDKTEPTYKMEYCGEDDNNIEVGTKTPLQGNGDFRNQECLDLLNEADIVVTNPPFSMYREYIATLVEHNKKFLVIGNKNSITYKEIFPLLKENQMWPGYTNVKEFIQPDGTIKKFGNIGWFTNLDIKKRHEEIILWKQFNQNDFPMYDNYAAWNVNKVAEIPVEDEFVVDVNEEISGRLQSTYESDFELLEHNEETNLYKVKITRPVMGVPITFLDSYNPEQFKIVGNEYSLDIPKGRGYVNNKRMYSRIFIKRK